MRRVIHRRQLGWLLIIGLLFSGMCVRFVCADSVLSKETPISLAHSCRAVRDVYTGILFDKGGPDHQVCASPGSAEAEYEAICQLFLGTVFSDPHLLLRKTERAGASDIFRKRDPIIRYIHRQDGKKD